MSQCTDVEEWHTPNVEMFTKRKFQWITKGSPSEPVTALRDFLTLGSLSVLGKTYLLVFGVVG